MNIKYLNLTSLKITFFFIFFVFSISSASAISANASDPHYSARLDVMWLSIFQSEVLGSIVLIALLLAFCFRYGLEPPDTFVVIMPTIIGLTYSSSIPDSVRNVLVIGAGAIVGYGILRFIRV